MSIIFFKGQQFLIKVKAFSFINTTFLSYVNKTNLT